MCAGSTGFHERDAARRAADSPAESGSAGRGGDGRGSYVVRPARARPVRPALRTARSARRGRPAAGVRRHPRCHPGPATPAAVRRPGPAGLRGSRRGHRRHDAAVHAGRRAHPSRHRVRIRVPRPAGGVAVRAGQRAQALGCHSRRRRRPAHPALARRNRPGRPRVRLVRSSLLGRLHPADPARWRPRHRPDRAGRLHAGGRCRRHGRGRPEPGPGDLAAARHHARSCRPASGRPVQPGIPRSPAPFRGCLRDPDEP